MRPESGFRFAPSCPVNQKSDNGVTIVWHDVIFKCFSRCFVSLVNFSYWSKFHINIIASSKVMRIFFYKGLTRNPEIRYNPSKFCLIFENWGGVRDTTYGTNFSN